MIKVIGAMLLTILCVAGCGAENEVAKHKSVIGKNLIEPTKLNGGIQLPNDFAAFVVDEGVGEKARHLVVRENGDIFVKLQKLNNEFGIVALRDVDGDGVIDEKKMFADFIGTGIDIYDGYLYASSPFEVYRWPLHQKELLPQLDKELIISGFPEQHDHWSKPFTLDDEGNIYVTVGSPSNACQETARSPGSPGLMPCPQRELQSGIWKFKASKLGQKHGVDGVAYGVGIRNAVALDWNHDVQKLHAVQHGRDQLNTLWPELFTEADNAILPAEEFISVEEGSDFGWPYCFYDQIQGKKVLSPEYGGNGDTQGRCKSVNKPIVAFPGHWAPNDLLFYEGDQFPERYKNGAFIAFHGSWNRAPMQQAGYKVVFVPFVNGVPSGEPELFASGFIGRKSIYSPGEAAHRPMGLAEGPDGSLYISDSVKGKIWRVMYYGKGSYTYDNSEDASFNREALAKSEAVGSVSSANNADAGKEVYDTYCLVCHQRNGLGVSGLNPPLTSSEWVGGADEKLINVVLKGLAGQTVDGENYRNVMPPHRHLTDKQVSLVLTYIRSNFGNSYPSISEKQVSEQRVKLEEDKNEK